MEKQPVDYERDEELPPLDSLPIKDLKRYRQEVFKAIQETTDRGWSKSLDSHLSEIDELIEAHYKQITRMLDGG